MMRIEFDEKLFFKVVTIGTGAVAGAAVGYYLNAIRNDNKKTKTEIKSKSETDDIYIKLLEAKINQIESETEKD